MLNSKQATPMISQYLKIKSENQNNLLFYRMGDFYELFFDDAVLAAEALNITLTKRGKYLDKDIAMCGVPVNSYEKYLSRLIKLGYKVAICEQVEDPKEAKKRGYKSIVRREVVRTITSGTLLEDMYLNTKENNFLASVANIRSECGLAWFDISTGDFFTQDITRGDLSEAITRIEPREILIPDNIIQKDYKSGALRNWEHVITVLPNSRFDSRSGDVKLKAAFGVDTLEGFGAFTRPELAAAGAIVQYIEHTQKGNMPQIASPRRFFDGITMEIDPSTRRSLELTRTLNGERKFSLLSAIDQTLTGSGARLLFSQLSTPLTNPVLINNRLDIVEYFFNNSQILKVLSEFLRGMPDIERSLLRLLSDRGGPRDLIAIKIGLDLTRKIKKSIGNKKIPTGLRDIFSELSELNHLVDNLRKAIISDPPINSKDGGFVKEGYDEQFDQMQKLKDDSRQLIAEFQKQYIEITEIQTLKIKYNNVLGYFIEVSVKNSEIISGRSDDTFIHRQTMKNVVRYTTLELNELEGKIASAADKALALEILIFHDLLRKINIEAGKVSLTAKALAQLDVSTSLAKLAIDSRYCRPKVDNSLSFKIIGGRHPLVETSQTMSLRDTRSSQASLNFVKNNCDLSEKNNLWLLTGPNMAGKSTFLRQNALIAILAQMGSFVPADSAHIGVIDRLFSRVGAADDIARGQSTFMVEMVETSLILSQATNRSFVILDEIGRGTATFDGLSIAWAVVEYLHDVNRSRAIFATHYHELTALKSKLTSMSCHNMKVKEWQGKIIFLHEVIEGVADRSYGIHVAKLAGLPADVLDRAEMVLQALEDNKNIGTLGKNSLEALPLFSEKKPSHESISSKNSKLKVELDNVIADEMSPRDALEFIYRLKELIS